MISMLKAPKTDIFYKKFSSITRWKLWHQYLEFVYKRTIIDAIHMNIAPISERKKPMCLLCGASGEVTAEEFIEFTLRSNNKSKILIIDIGSPQISIINIFDLLFDLNVNSINSSAVTSPLAPHKRHMGFFLSEIGAIFI